jgi:hypothetical protein
MLRETPADYRIGITTRNSNKQTEDAIGLASLCLLLAAGIAADVAGTRHRIYFASRAA